MNLRHDLPLKSIKLTHRPSSVVDAAELASTQQLVPELLHVHTLRVSSGDARDHDVRLWQSLHGDG